MLTARACRWAIQQIRREHASANGIRRRLRTGWRTMWESIRPLLAAADADSARFENVTILGVHEHGWHHVSTKPPQLGGRGPKELTGLLDLTRDEHGRIHARLLDLFPGRSGEDLQDRLRQRGEAFRARVEIATGVVDEVRRRVQQDIHGHRGHKNDPLYRIRHVLRAGQENLTDRQRARLVTAFTSDQRHVEVEVAWSCAQQVRAAYHQDSHAAGRTIAEKILDTFASCPIPEVTRLGRTLRQ